MSQRPRRGCVNQVSSVKSEPGHSSELVATISSSIVNKQSERDATKLERPRRSCASLASTIKVETRQTKDPKTQRNTQKNGKRGNKHNAKDGMPAGKVSQKFRSRKEKASTGKLQMIKSEPADEFVQSDLDCRSQSDTFVPAATPVTIKSEPEDQFLSPSNAEVLHQQKATEKSTLVSNTVSLSSDAFGACKRDYVTPEDASAVIKEVVKNRSLFEDLLPTDSSVSCSITGFQPAAVKIKSEFPDEVIEIDGFTAPKEERFPHIPKIKSGFINALRQRIGYHMKADLKDLDCGIRIKSEPIDCEEEQGSSQVTVKKEVIENVCQTNTNTSSESERGQVLSATIGTRRNSEQSERNLFDVILIEDDAPLEQEPVAQKVAERSRDRDVSRFSLTSLSKFRAGLSDLKKNSASQKQDDSESNLELTSNSDPETGKKTDVCESSSDTRVPVSDQVSSDIDIREPEEETVLTGIDRTKSFEAICNGVKEFNSEKGNLYAEHAERNKILECTDEECFSSYAGKPTNEGQNSYLDSQCDGEEGSSSCVQKRSISPIENKVHQSGCSANEDHCNKTESHLLAEPIGAPIHDAQQSYRTNLVDTKHSKYSLGDAERQLVEATVSTDKSKEIDRMNGNEENVFLLKTTSDDISPQKQMQNCILGRPEDQTDKNVQNNCSVEKLQDKGNCSSLVANDPSLCKSTTLHINHQEDVDRNSIVQVKQGINMVVGQASGNAFDRDRQNRDVETSFPKCTDKVFENTGALEEGIKTLTNPVEGISMQLDMAETGIPDTGDGKKLIKNRAKEEQKQNFSSAVVVSIDLGESPACVEQLTFHDDANLPVNDISDIDSDDWEEIEMTDDESDKGSKTDNAIEETEKQAAFSGIDANILEQTKLYSEQVQEVRDVALNLKTAFVSVAENQVHVHVDSTAEKDDVCKEKQQVSDQPSLPAVFHEQSAADTEKLDVASTVQGSRGLSPGNTSQLLQNLGFRQTDLQAGGVGSESRETTLCEEVQENHQTLSQGESDITSEHLQKSVECLPQQKEQELHLNENEKELEEKTEICTVDNTHVDIIVSVENEDQEADQTLPNVESELTINGPSWDRSEPFSVNEEPSTVQILIERESQLIADEHKPEVEVLPKEQKEDPHEAVVERGLEMTSANSIAKNTENLAVQQNKEACPGIIDLCLQEKKQESTNTLNEGESKLILSEDVPKLPQNNLALEKPVIPQTSVQKEIEFTIKENEPETKETCTLSKKKGQQTSSEKGKELQLNFSRIVPENTETPPELEQREVCQISFRDELEHTQISAVKEAEHSPASTSPEQEKENVSKSLVKTECASPTFDFLTTQPVGQTCYETAAALPELGETSNIIAQEDHTLGSGTLIQDERGESVNVPKQKSKSNIGLCTTSTSSKVQAAREKLMALLSQDQVASMETGTVSSVAVNITKKSQNMVVAREFEASRLKEIVCDLCSISFPFIDCFRSHVIEQHQDIVRLHYGCCLCSRSFLELRQLCIHFHQEHNHNILFCNRCSRGFVDCLPALLHCAWHCAQSEDIALHPCFCTYCKRIHLTVKYEELEDILTYPVSGNALHESNSNLQRKYCPMCKKQFKFLDCYRSHMVELHDEKRVSIGCDACQLFFSKESLKEHWQIIHKLPEKYSVCEKCGAAFINMGQSIYHACPSMVVFKFGDKISQVVKAAVHPCFCQHCKKVHHVVKSVFILKNRGFSAVARESAVKIQQEALKQCGIPYSYDEQVETLKKYEPEKEKLCGVCNIHFKNVECYKNHLVCVHGVKGLVLECALCETQFGKKLDLRLHWEAAHEISTVYCQNCFTMFGTFEKLFIHGRIGCGPKDSSEEKHPCYCCHCDQVHLVPKVPLRIENVVSIAAGEQEADQSSGGLKLNCNLCTKLFSNEDCLVNHKYCSHNINGTHLTCTACGLKCMDKDGLMVHLVEAHNLPRYFCQRCFVKFNTEGHLLLHKQFMCAADLEQFKKHPLFCQICKGFHLLNKRSQPDPKMERQNPNLAQLLKEGYALKSTPRSSESSALTTTGKSVVPEIPGTAQRLESLLPKVLKLVTKNSDDKTKQIPKKQNQEKEFKIGHERGGTQTVEGTADAAPSTVMHWFSQFDMAEKARKWTQGKTSEADTFSLKSYPVGKDSEVTSGISHSNKSEMNESAAPAAKEVSSTDIVKLSFTTDVTVGLVGSKVEHLANTSAVCQPAGSDLTVTTKVLNLSVKKSNRIDDGEKCSDHKQHNGISLKALTFSGDPMLKKEEIGNILETSVPSNFTYKNENAPRGTDEQARKRSGNQMNGNGQDQLPHLKVMTFQSISNSEEADTDDKRDTLPIHSDGKALCHKTGKLLEAHPTADATSPEKELVGAKNEVKFDAASHIFKERNKIHFDDQCISEDEATCVMDEGSASATDMTGESTFESGPEETKEKGPNVGRDGVLEEDKTETNFGKHKRRPKAGKYWYEVDKVKIGMLDLPVLQSEEDKASRKFLKRKISCEGDCCESCLLHMNPVFFRPEKSSRKGPSKTKSPDGERSVSKISGKTHRDDEPHVQVKCTEESFSALEKNKKRKMGKHEKEIELHPTASLEPYSKRNKVGPEIARTDTIFLDVCIPKGRRKIIEGDVKFFCWICQIGFSDSSCFESHCLQEHISNVPGFFTFSCLVCSSTFKKQSDVYRHLKECHSINPYLCDRCGQAYWKDIEDVCENSEEHCDTKNSVHGKGSENVHVVPPFCTKCKAIHIQYSTAGKDTPEGFDKFNHLLVGLGGDLFLFQCTVCGDKLRHLDCFKAHCRAHDSGVASKRTSLCFQCMANSHDSTIAKEDSLNLIHSSGSEKLLHGPLSQETEHISSSTHQDIAKEIQNCEATFTQDKKELCSSSTETSTDKEILPPVSQKTREIPVSHEIQVQDADMFTVSNHPSSVACLDNVNMESATAEKCFVCFSGHSPDDTDRYYYGDNCVLCRYGFSDLICFKLHVLNNHLSETLSISECSGFYCDSCNLKFSSESILLRHWDILHSIEYLFCQICRQFCRGSNILNHVESHRKDAYSRRILRTFNSIMEQGYNSRIAEENQGPPVRLVLCDTCKRVHEDDKYRVFADEEKERGIGDCSVVCKECGKEFKRLSCGRNHSLSHHVVPKNELQIVQCVICWKFFPTKELLLDHVNSLHDISSDWSLMDKVLCKDCGELHLRDFDAKWNNKTGKYSSSQDEFQCRLCCNSYTRKTGLTKHLLKLHNQSPFDCQFCCLSFETRAEVQMHTGSDHLNLEG